MQSNTLAQNMALEMNRKSNENILKTQHKKLQKGGIYFIYKKVGCCSGLHYIVQVLPSLSQTCTSPSQNDFLCAVKKQPTACQSLLYSLFI